MTMAYSSYGGNAGTWFQLPRYSVAQPYFGQRINQQNGADHLCRLRATRQRRRHGLLRAEPGAGPARRRHRRHEQHPDVQRAGPRHAQRRRRAELELVVLGQLRRHSFCTLYPINPFKKIGDTQNLSGGSDAFVSAASSYHPGGANFLFGDGSVRFLKDTIDSWPINPGPGYPGRRHPAARLQLALHDRARGEGRRLPALSTIAGGEVISADAC